MLDQEQVKARIVGQSAGTQGHDIVLRPSGKAVGDGDTGMCVLDGWAGEGFAGQQARVHLQLEGAGGGGTRSQSSWRWDGLGGGVCIGSRNPEAGERGKN